MMKYGCSLMLLLWAGSAYFYWTKLDPNLEARFWMAVGLGLGIAFVVGQFWSLINSLKKLKVSSRPIESWIDGEYVGISGALRPKEAALKGPASDLPGVILEYELERRVVNRSNKGNSVSYTKDISGFLMAPCGIQTKRGFVRLHGFPMLNKFKSKLYKDPEDLKRMADFLANAHYEPVTINPLKAWEELMAVYADEDGDVNKNFVNSHSPIRPDQYQPQNSQNDEAVEETHNDLKESIAEKITREMSDHTYHISERLVPVGMEVTAFGTYNQRLKAIDVGSGTKNLSHTLQPGELSSVAKRGVLMSILGLIFWGSCVVVANYFAMPEVKEYLDEQGVRQYFEKYLS